MDRQVEDAVDEFAKELARKIDEDIMKAAAATGEDRLTPLLQVAVHVMQADLPDRERVDWLGSVQSEYDTLTNSYRVTLVQTHVPTHKTLAYHLLISDSAFQDTAQLEFLGYEAGKALGKEIHKYCVDELGIGKPDKELVDIALDTLPKPPPKLDLQKLSDECPICGETDDTFPSWGICPHVREKYLHAQ